MKHWLQQQLLARGARVAAVPACPAARIRICCITLSRRLVVQWCTVHFILLLLLLLLDLARLGSIAGAWICEGFLSLTSTVVHAVPAAVAAGGSILLLLLLLLLLLQRQWSHQAVRELKWALCE